jgi:hypothetical protein
MPESQEKKKMDATNRNKGLNHLHVVASLAKLTGRTKGGVGNEGHGRNGEKER